MFENLNHGKNKDWYYHLRPISQLYRWQMLQIGSKPGGGILYI